MYNVLLSKKAIKEWALLEQAGLAKKANELKKILRVNPFQNPPPYEKLTNEDGTKYSRRINIQHRLVYQVLKEKRIVHILRMWTHYE